MKKEGKRWLRQPLFSRGSQSVNRGALFIHFSTSDTTILNPDTFAHLNTLVPLLLHDCLLSPPFPVHFPNTSQSEPFKMKIRFYYSSAETLQPHFLASRRNSTLYYGYKPLPPSISLASFPSSLPLLSPPLAYTLPVVFGTSLPYYSEPGHRTRRC